MIESDDTPNRAIDRDVRLEQLGERLSSLRLCWPRAEDRMRSSLECRGQLTAVVAFEEGDKLELIDGFKRRRAAQRLGWTELRVRVLGVGPAEAVAAIGALHERTGLTPLEEGWMIRWLRREHGLSQGAIGHLLHRHQSWVSRRLLLAESLDEAVQADVRLGLLWARAAMAVAALSRSNQRQAAALVMRRGMTSRQAEAMVARLKRLSSDDERASAMHQWPDGPQRRSAKAARSRPAAEVMMTEIATIKRVSAKLEAQLMARPLAALGTDAAARVIDELAKLGGVLAALDGTISGAIKRHEELSDVQLAYA